MSTSIKDVCYTVEEVAVILKMDRQSVYRYIRRGDIPSFKVGVLIRVPASWVVSMLSKGELDSPVENGTGEE